jgi:hypothetical protein
MEKFGLKPTAPKFGRAIRPRAGAARAYAKARQEQTRLEALLRQAKV